jgi:hypothetical protein
MKIVCAGLSGDENGWSGSLAVLSGIVVGENLKFLDVVDG